MAMIDIIILVIVGGSALFGFIRGLVKEALSLASWFAAIVAGTFFSGQLADVMTDLINNPSLRRMAAFALIFIGVVFVGSIISNLVSKLTQAAGLKGTDRILGGLFGILRGAIIVLVAVFLSLSFEASQSWLEESVIVPYAVTLIEKLQPILNIEPAVFGSGGA